MNIFRWHLGGLENNTVFLAGRNTFWFAVEYWLEVNGKVELFAIKGTHLPQCQNCFIKNDSRIWNVIHLGDGDKTKWMKLCSFFRKAYCNVIMLLIVLNPLWFILCCSSVEADIWGVIFISFESEELSSAVPWFLLIKNITE